MKFNEDLFHHSILAKQKNIFCESERRDLFDVYTPASIDNVRLNFHLIFNNNLHFLDWSNYCRTWRTEINYWRNDINNHVDEQKRKLDDEVAEHIRTKANFVAVEVKTGRRISRSRDYNQQKEKLDDLIKEINSMKENMLSDDKYTTNIIRLLVNTIAVATIVIILK